MGLSSKGSYATLWEVKPGERSTQARISISKKNKETDKYEQTYGGYVRFAGKAHNVVKNMAEKDRVKITEFDIETKYDKEKKVTYTNTVVWDCETIGVVAQGEGGF